MKRNLYYVCVALVAIAIAGCTKPNEQLPVQDNTSTLKSASFSEDYNMVPDEILVKFKNGTNVSKKAALLDKLGGKLKQKVISKMMERAGDEEGISLVTIKGTVAEALAKVKGDPDIEYAEPNFIYTHFDGPSDLYFSNTSLWGMYSAKSTPANAYGCGAVNAWTAGHTGSSTVYVGVIDEGIQYTHPDLLGQIWTNPNEIPGDGIDNDNNGYIDDIQGWDFANNDNTIFNGGAGSTVDAHGTHVSGTIGAKANNDGVVGINWEITIISAKFLGSNGGTTANAVLAVDYLTNLKTLKKLNIVATNNSWGGGGYSQSLFNAISRANVAGILFVAAAGNSKSNNDRKASYPSNYDLPNVIAVAAITSTGALASFSNYGAKTVDLGAPGQGIWSSVPMNSWASYSGTSMATPHVTGACALYASTHPGATAAQIKTAILGSTVPTASLSGKCVTGGRLNVSGF
jgi:subtilisin family serine protease